MAPTRCPCDTALPYADCCGPLHAGTAARDALALMRSRYSAYALGLEDHLRASWDPAHCPADLSLDGRTRWLRLQILQHRRIDEDNETVRFSATFIQAGQHRQMSELSRFRRVDGRWLYVDGDVEA